MQVQSEEFIRLFNLLEAALNERHKQERYTTFVKLVEEVSNIDYVIRHNRYVLEDIAALRNVIIHKEGQLITAIPTDETISTLKKILEQFTQPKSLLDICHENVCILEAHYKLDVALKLMANKDYSQLPVYEGKIYIGLLTGNVITRWLARSINSAGDINKSLDDLSVKEVLRFAEASDQVTFIPRNMNVNEFIARTMKSPSPSGVYLLTSNGEMDEKPISIITNDDYATIWNALGI